MAKETVYNNTLVSGAADETLTYTRYVKDESSGKSTKELLDEKVNKTDQLGTTQIADKAVTTEKLENESVTTDKLNAASVTTDKVADANITTSKLADSSVETEKINNKAVTTDKLNDGAVDNSKLSPNAVTSEKIKNESIITEKLNDRAVTTEKVEEKAITNTKIGDSAVDGRTISEASVEKKHLANDSVATEKLQDSAITSDKIHTDAVTEEKIKDSSVSNSKLADNSVGTSKIKDGNITNEKVANNTLTQDKLDPELRKAIQAATGLPENLVEVIQDVDKEVKTLHSKDTDLQSQITDKQQQITAHDKDIELLQTRSTQMEKTINNIAATGGASVANSVAYTNTTSGLESVNAQGAIDELAAKNKSQDATILAKAEMSDVQAAVSELKEKDSALSEEIAKKANNSDVTSKFTEESKRVNVELSKKANAEDVSSQMQTEQERVNAEFAKKFDKKSILQESGDAEDKVMSQKAVSGKLSDLVSDQNEINRSFSISNKNIPYDLCEKYFTLLVNRRLTDTGLWVYGKKDKDANILIPRNDIESLLVIKSTKIKYNKIAFLKSKTIVIEQRADFCDDANSFVLNYDEIYYNDNIPKDCQYIYVEIKLEGEQKLDTIAFGASALSKYNDYINKKYINYNTEKNNILFGDETKCSTLDINEFVKENGVYTGNVGDNPTLASKENWISIKIPVKFGEVFKSKFYAGANTIQVNSQNVITTSFKNDNSLNSIKINKYAKYLIYSYPNNRNINISIFDNVFLFDIDKDKVDKKNIQINATGNISDSTTMDTYKLSVENSKIMYVKSRLYSGSDVVTLSYWDKNKAFIKYEGKMNTEDLICSIYSQIPENAAYAYVTTRIGYDVSICVDAMTDYILNNALSSRKETQEESLVKHYEYSGNRLNLNGFTVKTIGKGIIVAYVLSNTTPDDGYLSGQGCAVYDKYLFRLHQNGYCDVFDIENVDKVQKVNSFNLGSYNKKNHANCCQFGTNVDSFTNMPYLYVADCTKKCFVEKITTKGSTLLQTITLDLTSVSSNLNVIAGDDGFIWAFGGDNKTDGKLYFMKFKLPNPSDGDVTLHDSDIIDSWQEEHYDYTNNVWQGGMIRNGKLYFLFGQKSSSRKMYVYDTTTHIKTNIVDFQKAIADEMEDCDVYDGKLLLVCNGVNEAYLLDF